MSSVLERNLKALLKSNPVLVAKLHSIKTNSRFELFMDQKDNININLFDKETQLPLYETKPIEEITNRYNEIISEKSRYPFLFFYGIGNGLLVRMFLNINKYIFVVEPNLELIYIALSLFDYSKEIESERFKIYLESDFTIKEIGLLFAHKDIKAFLKLYSLEIESPYYEKLYSSNIINLNREITTQIFHIVQSEGNSADDSLIGLNHHLQHIPEIVKSYTLKSAFNSRNSDIAVIVSTGPSLAKQLPLLKRYQNYLTILCIDASLPILQKEGIRPDFVFSLERVEATSKFFENLDKELLKDTIFIPTSISHPKTIQNLKDFKKVVSMRPFAYTKLFRLEKWGYVGVGMSAANMAFDFARFAEFPNIVFIGQDLAFGDDGTTHSKGAIYGEKEEQYYKNKNRIKIKGYYGDEVETSKIWDMFLNSFRKDVPDAVKDGIKVYNCTEGGAYIDGAEHISFREFLESIPQIEKPQIELERVSESWQKHYLQRSKKLITLILERLNCIQKEIKDTFLEVMEIIENLEKLEKEEKLEEIDFDALISTIDKIDRIKDIYENDKVLKKFGNITMPLILNAELELAVIMVRESNDELSRKVKLIDWIYAHKSWLFFLAGAIENIIFIMEKNLKEVY